MKGLFLFFFIFVIKISFSQHRNTPLPYVPQEPKFDTAPYFPGGPIAMVKYFKDSIRYPEPEKTKGIQGNILLKFDVTKTGDIKNIQQLNGVPGGPNLVTEAIRVIQSMPKWIPATKNDQKVEEEYILAVPFKIKNKKTKTNQLILSGE